MAGQPGDPDYVAPSYASLLGAANPFAKPYTLNNVRVDPAAVPPPPGTIAPGVTLQNPTPAGYDFNAQLQSALGKAPAAVPVNPTLRDVPPTVAPAVAQAAGGVPALPPGGWGAGGVAAAKEKNQQTASTEYLNMLYNADPSKGPLGAFPQQRQAYEGEKSAETIMATAEQRKRLEEAGGLLGEEAAIGKGRADLERQAKARQEMSDKRLAEMDKFSKDLANEKIEKPSTFDNIRWTIAGMLGAIQQGMLHLPTNQIADRIQQNIQMDVERQKIEFERHKGRKEDLNSMYAKAYAATGDDMEATRLANGLGLEMAKKETGALVASADSDVARARGDVMNAAIDMKKAQLAGAEAESEISHHKYTPATAGSSGPVLDEKALLKRMHELRDKAAEHGVNISPQDARRAAVIEQTGRDPYANYAGAAGTPLISYAKKEKPTKEEAHAAQQAAGSEEVNRQFADMHKNPVLDEIGWGARSVTQALPQGLGGTSASITSSKVDALNLQVLGAAGRVLKDSEGRIAPPVLKALEKFEVKDGDSKELAQRKLQGAQNFINATARQGGTLNAPSPAQEQQTQGAAAEAGAKPVAP